LIVGSGIDVIEIARVERALARSGARFEERVFSPAEIAHCRKFRRAAPHYALRFAAKEAVMKAVGTGWSRGVRWVDIETAPAGVAGLALRLHGRVGEIARERGAASAHLAVTRSRSHAVAVVVLEGTPA
jgi:holo-[acyl-carrier protein] synthase